MTNRPEEIIVQYRIALTKCDEEILRLRKGYARILNIFFGKVHDADLDDIIAICEANLNADGRVLGKDPSSKRKDNEEEPADDEDEDLGIRID